MERPQVKAITGLLSKAAGLVFFAFLAISLGVIFGYLFEDWVKQQPGTVVQAPVTGTEDYPATVQDKQDTTSTQIPDKSTTIKNVTPKHEPSATSQRSTTPSAPVAYKVRVGPFATRDAAQIAAKKLETAGYPVYVSTKAPFTVQVGAFGNQSNADHLKTELTGKGYTAFVKQN